VIQKSFSRVCKSWWTGLLRRKLLAKTNFCFAKIRRLRERLATRSRNSKWVGLFDHPQVWLRRSPRSFLAETISDWIASLNAREDGRNWARLIGGQVCFAQRSQRRKVCCLVVPIYYRRVLFLASSLYLVYNSG